MGVRGLAVAALVLVIACAGSGSTAVSAPSTPTPAPMAALFPYFGSYSTSDGDLIVIARLGWFFDLGTSDYRTIYATASANHFTIGPTFQEPLPKAADLVFGRDSVTIVEPGRTRLARRIAYQQTDATIQAGGAQLAATITEPLRPAPHPGIVIVHGAEPGQRYFYDVWVGVYAWLGLTVLTYDKRGQGASTGTYPGEFPSPGALTTYADDASAAFDFLAHWPGVDPQRVGFHGGSQGGWTVPLAMHRHPGAAFAILASAPATTVDQTDLWAGFSGGGEAMPSESTDQMLAAVRSTHSGYDPLSALRALSVPVLWLLGSNDRTVPTTVCVEILESLNKRNFTVQKLPTGHGLLVNPTGLLADDAKSPGLAPQLVPAIKDWLGAVTGG